MSVSSLLFLAHSRPLQCLWLNESLTFFIYSLWSLFYELSGSECPFVFFLLCVPKESPSLDWWCPDFRHQRRESAGILYKARFFIAVIVLLALLWVLLEGRGCSVQRPELSVIQFMQGKTHRWFVNLLFCLWPWPWGWSFSFGNLQLQILIFPCLPFPQLLWNRRLFNDRRKIHIVDSRRSLGTIWFYLWFYGWGEVPREEGLD